MNAMLKPGITDTVYCVEGRHHVPRDQLTKITTSKPGIMRTSCIACQARVLDGRAKVKARE